MDYGKYRYEQTKREKESHKHQQSAKLKEIRLRPNIEVHDYDVKLNKAKDFLEKKYKVKINLRFRGREIVHKAKGMEILNRFIDDLKDHGVPETRPKTIGKMTLITLGPTSHKVKQTKPQHQ